MATPAATQLERVLSAVFPGIRFGRRNCRKISGSSWWSQHSWDNARDIYPPAHISYTDDREEYQAYLDVVSDFIKANAVELNIRVHLWRVKNHYNHIHVDFWPRGWATPPCAGGSPRYKYQDGSVESTARLVNTYGGSTDPVVPEEEDVLRRGDKGKRVGKAQRRLMALGYALPQYADDEDFGAETEAAVKAFQTDRELPVDGVLYSTDIVELYTPQCV